MALNFGQDNLFGDASDVGIGKRKERGLSWTTSFPAFIPLVPSTSDAVYAADQGVGSPGGETFLAPVSLPDESFITSVTVFGDDNSETWKLWRSATNLGSREIIATANLNTVDITITKPVIDTKNFLYFLEVTTNDLIFGARIEYEK